ncbi:MAG: PIN domain-containing protein [Deltaproteobacteria bacterium]|nr:PIN domain-containing protein [Deltaproteobacteria bacterium]
MRLYVDSDVLIAHLRGERRALSFFRKVASREGAHLWVGAVQRAELVFFMRKHEEVGTLALLSRFRTEPLTQEAVDLGGAYYRKWHGSHGTDVNDALLAATVALTGGRLYTLNVKHFPMDDLAVRRAWAV